MILNESTIPDLLSGPVTIKWEEGAPAPVASGFHTAVLYNGAIYVGGGMCSYDDNDDDNYIINIYHPDTNKWDDAIDSPHVGFAMTAQVDKLIIVGGEIRGSTKITNKLLTLQGDQWEDYSLMPTARAGASVVCHQSMMIVMGGMNENHTLRTTELLDSSTGQWLKCNDLPQPLYWFHSVIVGDMLYALGGLSTGDYSKAVYASPLHALSNQQLKWQQLVDTPWEASTAVSVNNKYLLAIGGDITEEDTVHACTVCVLKRDVGSTSWQSISSLPNIHIYTSAVSLGNQIIVIGGGDETGSVHKTVTIGTFQ